MHKGARHIRYQLLFSEYDRKVEKQELSKELYRVALKVASKDCNQRQQSIQQFIEEWNEVKTTYITE
jgi:translation initiation factor IF-3